MLTRNDPCWCGSGTKWKKCHYPKEAPSSSESLAEQYLKKYGIWLKTPEQIAGIRSACQLAAFILEETCKQAILGVPTSALDTYAHRLCIEAGATAATLGYGTPPYPYSICTSLNEVICHGFPDEVPLKDGDILNVDVSPILNGYFGDCSKMVLIGNPSKEKKHLVQVSKECLDKAIAILRPGIMLYEIGEVISDHAEKEGCSVVDQFVGHGVGLQFHEQPQVPHHRNQLKIPLVPGMIFTIEPMINAGRKEAVIDKENEWTARTIDGKPSAQWEHTVLITETGAEVLTLLQA